MIMSDARSAIATRTEFGVPEIGDGTTLASIILNPLTPFTLENEITRIIIIIALDLTAVRSHACRDVVYLSFSSTTAPIPHVPHG